ncbi:MAG: hypothetical protein HY271_09745 [Deltaproteobacteria bacterium]|nr:hypothetical protein [Deltaproteobacteria bacterium]
MRTFLLTLALIGLASCVPLSDHPAGDEKNSEFDARLQGVWRAASGDGPLLLFVGPGDDAGHGVQLMTVEETRDQRWKTVEYAGISTRGGRHGFLSVRYQTTGGERRGWVIARYTLAGRDRLQLYTLDHTRLAALINAGRVSGRVSGDGPYADVDVTMGSGAALIALLESKDGQRLFGPPHTLVRGAHQSTGTGVTPTPSR